MGAPRTTCSDCDTQLQPIKLVDATALSWGAGTNRVDLAYAAQDAEPGFVFGIATQGSVYGRICTQCGRILLYATPMES